MAKKLLMIALLLVVTLCSAQAFLGNDPSDVVFARNFLPGTRTYSTLTNAIDRLGTREKTVIVDTGSWSLTNDLTIPTNINLLVTPDSLITVSTGKILTVSGFISSGDWQIFGGLGIVTGPCDNAFVYTDWVATNQNIAFLGTPYTSLVTTVILDGRSYASTNWTTNLVTGTSNSIMIAITNYDNNVSNGLMNSITSRVDGLSNIVFGSTVTVQNIRFQDWPLFGASINTTGGQVYGTNQSNTYVVVSNWSAVFANNYSSSWSAATERFTPKKAGIHVVRTTLSMGIGANTNNQWELFWTMNGENGSGGAVEFLMDKQAAGFLQDDILLNGTARFNAAATNEFWEINVRGIQTGAVNYGYADIYYIGDPALAQ